MKVWSELGRSPGTKDCNQFLFFHLEKPMDWEYTMVTVCVIQSVGQECSDLKHEISLEWVLIYIHTALVSFIYYQWHAQQQQQNSYFTHFISVTPVSESLWPHDSHHTRPPCPLTNPRVQANICSWRRWCHPAISSSLIPFSSWSKSLPSSEVFMSQVYAWGGQNTGVSALASVFPKNTQDWSP